MLKFATLVFALLTATFFHSPTQAFIQQQQQQQHQLVVQQTTSTEIMSAQSTSSEQHSDHPFCHLPGDPSLILTTNVDLADKKEIMKCE